MALIHAERLLLYDEERCILFLDWVTIGREMRRAAAYNYAVHSKNKASLVSREGPRLTESLPLAGQMSRL